MTTMSENTMNSELRRMLGLLLAIAALWLLAMPAARANTCTVSITDIDVGVISPLANTDYTARGTLTVNCTWTLGQSPLLLP
ncbi:hypothetical protein FPK55_25250, partial [Acinetobacter baumannii]|nr:hypothetical protein [Acinetobacter baumannii]